MSGRVLSGLAVIVAASFSTNSMAQDIKKLEQCLLDQLQVADDSQTIGDIRKTCKQLLNKPDEEAIARDWAKTFKDSPEAAEAFEPGIISRRFINEWVTEENPFVITPHRMNYVLPVLTTSGVNDEAYDEIPEFEDNFENIESKFQLSVKVPLNNDSLFIDGDRLYFAFTIEAWWQVYSDNISKPFRETNYRPEMFYLAPLDWHPLGGNTGFSVGVEHQSNGRSNLLSRSWNRVYADFLFEKGNFAMSFRPWWRVTEDEKEFPGDPKGDDNPDIDDYMGHFEIAGAYKWAWNDDYLELSLMKRQNFATNNGALELGFTFPLWGKLRGYAMFFDGYGESLIDYDHRQTRLGLGIALNDIL